MVMSFLDSHREELGIEPICRELAIAPSSYHDHAARLADPGKRSVRVRRDDEIKQQIRRVHGDSSGLYGTRKVWHQMRREGATVAKCTVERLMRAMGLAGVRRGKTTITTVSNPKAPCPLDKVNREFRVSRPNALWVVDFTYVHTWAGFVYVAFVIDAYARRIVGWKVSTAPTASFVLDALEQAIHARRPAPEDGLIHHSDRGVQGGFNRSSQHPDRGGCDGHSETAIGSMWATAIAVTWSAICGRTARATAVLDVDRDRHKQRGSCCQGWRIATCGNQMVSGGRRYATSDVQVRGEAAVRKISVLGGARGDRATARPGP